MVIANFAFPMKPVRVHWSVFSDMNMDDYSMEVKLDGFRCMVQVDSSVTFWTRDKVQMIIPHNLQEQLNTLQIPEGTLLDGEIWNMSKRGSWRQNRSEICALTLWDTIRFNNQDLSNEPLETRRECLDSILSKSKTEDIRATEILRPDATIAREIEQEARSFRQNAQSRSGFVHGIVLKRRGSPRRDNAVRCREHTDWLKLIFQGL
jgi:ATP-dependent DNA ligase